ncbi:MAG: transposase [Candidatus Omnitrophica bacterium]|nr:transposase [Candidatus Omnitrophota bacterium]
MGRYPRIYFQNAVYHICIRGNNKQQVLLAEDDKINLLKSIVKFQLRFGFKLHGFVLMDNHAHLIIAANSQISISKIMHAILLSYSVKFRKKYAYSGYVWQGRFRSKIIEGGNYILECLSYIHNNPLRAGLVNKPEDYYWSSYNSYYAVQSGIDSIINIDHYKD